MTARLILTTKRLFLSLMMLSTAHAQWEQLPPLPEPSGGFVCGHEKGKIVVIGGTNWEGGQKNWLRSRHEYDPAKQKWGTTTALQAPLAYAVSLQNGDKQLLHIGGTDGKKPQSDFKGRRQVVLSAGGSLGGVLEGRKTPFIVISGGTDDAVNLEGVTSETHSLTSRGTIKHADYPGKPFAVAASAVMGDELFVFGGMNYDKAAKAPLNSTEAYAFSPEKNTWRKLKVLDTPNRGLTAVTLDEQHIYLAGGYTDDFTADAFIYDVKADSYRKAKSLPYAAMVGLVKLDGFVYCMGGEDKKQSRTDKFFRISIAELLKP